MLERNQRRFETRSKHFRELGPVQLGSHRCNQYLMQHLPTRKINCTRCNSQFLMTAKGLVHLRKSRLPVADVVQNINTRKDIQDCQGPAAEFFSVSKTTGWDASTAGKTRELCESRCAAVFGGEGTTSTAAAKHSSIAFAFLRRTSHALRE